MLTNLFSFLKSLKNPESLSSSETDLSEHPFEYRYSFWFLYANGTEEWKIERRRKDTNTWVYLNDQGCLSNEYDCKKAIRRVIKRWDKNDKREKEQEKLKSHYGPPKTYP